MNISKYLYIYYYTLITELKKTKKMNRLELLQQKENNFRFIKSYPILNKLNLSPLKINIIQLILSYDDNGQEFYMNYKDIADIFSSTEKSIKTRIKELKEKKYITSKVKSNYNGKDGGSTSILRVNMDVIIKELTSNKTSNEVKEEKSINIPQELNKVVRDVKTENNNKEEKQVEMKKENKDEINIGNLFNDSSNNENVEKLLSDIEEPKSVKYDFGSDVSFLQEVEGEVFYVNNNGEYKVEEDKVDMFLMFIKEWKEDNSRNRFFQKLKRVTSNFGLNDKIEDEVEKFNNRIEY